jgi:hypothetical protein
MKLYPKKVIIGSIIIWLLFDSIILMAGAKYVDYFIVFLVFSILFTLGLALTNRITLQDGVLIIVQSNKKNLWSKKFIIPIHNIIEIGSADVKWPRFVKEKIFAIHFKEAQEEKILKLNQDAYFIKDLQCLFKYLENNYSIPCTKS